MSGSRYAVVFIDEKSRYVSAYCIESKDSFLTTLRKYLRDVRALGHRVRALWGINEESTYDMWDTKKGVQGIRSDRGSEFVK